MTRSGVVALAVSLVVPPNSGWRSAAPGVRLELPTDHRSHPDYKIEWWYYTGNLAAATGERYGYQLTFFRVGVDPNPPNPSRWAVRDLFMAHLALTDIDRQRHLYADRLNRAGIGWAGASAASYRVWNEDWLATLTPSGGHRLEARMPAFGLALELDPGKRAALHGLRGYSRKGDAPGNASHYYSLTRMPTRGQIEIDGRKIPVSGHSWMDHEFGTTFLEPGQVGWDWLALQLDDGRDLMLYRLRRADGSSDVHSSATLVDADGTTTVLNASAFRLVPGRTWTSPASLARYPVDWTVEVPSARLHLQVRAAVEAQELRTERSTRVTYWEGAVGVAGSRDGEPVSGRGYLEMTGYAGGSLIEQLR